MILVIIRGFFRFHIRDDPVLETCRYKKVGGSFLKNHDCLLKTDQKICLLVGGKTFSFEEAWQNARFVGEEQFGLIVEPHCEPVSFDFFIFHEQMIPAIDQINISGAQEIGIFWGHPQNRQGIPKEPTGAIPFGRTGAELKKVQAMAKASACTLFHLCNKSL